MVKIKTISLKKNPPASNASHARVLMAAIMEWRRIPPSRLSIRGAAGHLPSYQQAAEKMVNQVLCVSAILSAFVHVWAFAPSKTAPPWYVFLVATCVSSSILNHGFTRDFLKWLDRAMMLVGLPVTLIMSPCLKHCLMMAATVCLYFLGKTARSTWPHLISHWVLTLINVDIALSYW